MNNATPVWEILGDSVLGPRPLGSVVGGMFECFATEKEAWQALATRKDADAAELTAQAAAATQAANDARAKANKP